MISAGALLILFVVGAWVVQEGRGSDASARLEPYEEALDGARSWILARDALNLDEVWVLLEGVKVTSDEVLEEHVRSHVAPGRFEEFMHLIDASHAPPQLPEEMPSNRLESAMLASIGEPEDRARDIVDAYLREDLAGYNLTHQLVALVQWEQVGRPIPTHWEVLRDVIIERIQHEQMEDTRFSDLYAERAMLLSLHGHTECPAGQDEWAGTFLRAQNDDGSWPTNVKRPPERRGSSSHATALTYVALQEYLRCQRQQER